MNRVEIGSYSTRSGWKTLPKEQPKAKVKSKKRRRLTKKGVGLVVFAMLFGLCGFLFFNFANRVPGFNIPIIVQPAQSLCTNLLDPKCWTENFKPQLKQTEGFTNVLVVGLDTRKGSEGLLNTDTIALISFNHETQETMLISIPRDFYVSKYATRVNAIYAFTKDKDKTDPFKSLKSEVSAITGQDIHYFVTVKFDSFISLINEFDGIEVCPEEAFTAQYPNDYPAKGESQWLFYEFEQGCQDVTGEKALVYARFRYVSKGPSSLASDFSRARRQQEVIEAVKDKAMSQDLTITERASAYWKLIQSFQQNITTNINFEDVLAGLSYLDTANKDPLNVVLDPNFGGINNIIITDSSSGAYHIKPKDQTYGQIHKELDKIWANAELYKEKPKILVRNWGKTYLAANHPAKLLEKELTFKEFYVYQNEFGKTDLTGLRVVDFSNGEKAETLKQIMQELSIEKVTDPEEIGLTQTKSKEDIVIIVGLPSPTPTVVR